MAGEIMERLKAKVRELPHKSGVYIMKDAAGNIIYVGKAKSLKNRVSQYFLPLKGHTPKVLAMVEKVDDFDFIVTDTEFEALVLECNLIKLHRPKYNILLKDDKQYPFIRVTMNESWPRITLARKMGDDKATYFGPYSGAGVVNETISTAARLFLIPTCKRRFPSDIGRGRPCLNHHIGRCCAPCAGGVSEEEYRVLFEQLLSFLKGDYKKLVAELTKKMGEASDNMAFEQAAKYRDRIKHIEALGERQKVFAGDRSDRDMVACGRLGDHMCFVVLFIRGGMLIDKETTIITGTSHEEEGEAFCEFVRRYYTTRNFIPQKIYVEYEPEDRELLERLLGEKSGRRVRIIRPRKGETARLLDMAKENAAQELSHSAGREEKENRVLSELARILSLKGPPMRIEAYDISNTGESAAVGGMVVFKGGKPQKSLYRRFKIKTVDGADDYGAMREMIYRRMAAADEGREKFSELPDLILLDGGLGHVNIISKMLGALDIDIPVWGMVKNDRHRTRDLIGPRGEVGLSSASPVFPLVGSIQEEVHRYAIAYHRALRQKESMESVLEKIEGVGKAKSRALLKGLGSLDKIKKASVSELAGVPGISLGLGQRIYSYFNGPVPPEEGEN